MPEILAPWVLWLTMAFAVGFKIGNVARSQKRRQAWPVDDLAPANLEKDFRTFHEQAMDASRDGKSRMYRLGDDNQSFELIDVQSPYQQKNS